MTSQKKRKAVDQTDRAASERDGASEPEESLLSFMSKWAIEDSSPDESLDSSIFPRASSALDDFASTGGSSPRIDLTHLQHEPGVPTGSGDGSRYEMLRTIGEGGMGEVVLAFDQDLRRHIALKTVKPDTDRITLWRFFKEAQVLGQLGHPNIVTVYEMGLTKNDSPYYTMPVVQGETLHEIFYRLGADDPAYIKAFSLTRLMQVFLQVALAVEYAHAKGVIHRDIKPANIMVGEHGEVILLDWGVAKLMNEAEVHTADNPDLTQAGLAIGTPTYMSPEQVCGEKVDTRSDVYALGLLLYEMLTLQTPFRGKIMQVMTSHLEDEPEPPRVRAPERQVPIVLDMACRRALSKDPDERHQSARELHDEVQTWLEAAADKVKRQERASTLAKKGRTILDQYYALKKEVQRAEKSVADLRERFDDWQSIEEKAPLFKSEDEVTATRRALTEAASEVVMTLSAALGQDQEHAEARRLMAEYYWDRFQDAESRLDVASRDYLGRLVGSFDDGRFDAQLHGDGSLTVSSDPPGASVTLFRFQETNLVLDLVDEESLGTTPVETRSIPMGSYLLVLQKEGFRDVRCPVFISRSRDWSGTVRLFEEDRIGAAFRFVPGGSFVAGGDEEVRGWSLPRAEASLDDFFIAEQPVIVAEYLEFLNALGGEEALARAPRSGPEGGYYLEKDANGRFRVALREDGSPVWEPDLPITSISWHDAVAYCAWRSERDGIEYRLPTELEWEKAARGVDGRFFPWGNRLDPNLCNMSRSLREGAQPLPIDSFPTDCSVYGVRGCAGNVREWTATEVEEGQGPSGDTRVVRGGAFNLPAVISRAANRFWLPGDFALNYVGFRLARTAPGSATRTSE